MPLYEYQCQACGARFELIRKFSDPPLEVCPTCGAGPVEKLVSSPAFQFKGSGWYITDYARKSGGEAAAGKTDEKPAASAEAETKSDKGTSSPAKESKTADKAAPTPSSSSSSSSSTGSKDS
jgi:putative FmdB family regulatory protein